MKFLILAKFRLDALQRAGEQEPIGFKGGLQQAYEVAIDILANRTEVNFEFTHGRIGGGWVAIANADSHEQLWELLTRDQTFYSMFKWHIEPLMVASVEDGQRQKIFPEFLTLGGGW